MTIQAVVMGATGYVGGELLRLVSAHPSFQLAAAVSDSRSGDAIREVFPHLAAACGETRFHAHTDWLDALDPGSKLALFSAAPHGTSAALIQRALDKASSKNLDVHVVDASADFRYATQHEFEAVYGIEHGAPDLLAQFSTGLPEHVDSVSAPHVGNPGCFATAMLLASVPLLSSGVTDGHLHITGITGSTGSGRSPQAGTHHPERHSNLYAYKPLSHRHVPEVVHMAALASGAKPNIHFVPHSGPYARGIHVTVHARLNSDASSLKKHFENAYAGAPFVRVVDGTPKLKSIVASNYAEIGLAVDGDSVAVMCTIDNLVKGAAGGAMQWMNRLFELPETEGLEAAPPAWT